MLYSLVYVVEYGINISNGFIDSQKGLCLLVSAGSVGFCTRLQAVQDLTGICGFLRDFHLPAGSPVSCKKGKIPISSCSTYPSCRSDLHHASMGRVMQGLVLTYL